MFRKKYRLSADVPADTGPVLTALNLLTVTTTAASSVRGADIDHQLESVNTVGPPDPLINFFHGMHEVYEARDEYRRGTAKSEKTTTQRLRILRYRDQREIAPAVQDSHAQETTVCLNEVLDWIELPVEEE